MILIFLIQKILDALGRVTKNRTTIVIAHRLSTVIDADEILVLEKGQVAERGTHRDLVTRPGSLYANLWQKQNQTAKEEAQILAESVNTNNNRDNTAQTTVTGEGVQERL